MFKRTCHTYELGMDGDTSGVTLSASASFKSALSRSASCGCAKLFTEKDRTGGTKSISDSQREEYFAVFQTLNENG